MSWVTFTEIGFSHYKYWQEHEKKLMRKINELLRSIERDGAMQGIGMPEKLKHRTNQYSRRIDGSNRLVYEIYDGMIVVKSCKGHYEE